MQLPALLAASAALPLSTLARPGTSLKPYYVHSFRNTTCGPVENFYNPTPIAWDNSKTDTWLDNWWNSNSMTIQQNGFAPAFGRYALGIEGFSCKFSGSDSNCDMNVCDNPIINKKGPDTGPSYYVLSAIQRLHGYIKGFEETLETAAIVQSFESEMFTQYFYLDPNVYDALVMKEIINMVVTIVGMVAAGIGSVVTLGAGAVAAIGAAAALAGGAQTAAFLAIGNTAPDVFGATANAGHAMARALTVSFQGLFTLNDDLMSGKEIQGQGDIRQFLKGGRWINVPELNKTHGFDIMTGALQSIAINSIWRQQAVFIMGGGSCGDGDGIGTGPGDQEGDNSWCDENNKAWYLYFFDTKSQPSLTRPWLVRPMGHDRIGDKSLFEQQGKGTSEFKRIYNGNVIKSSITAWKVAGNNYDSAMFSSRMADTMKSGADPLSALTSLEGLWTIPVCDVGAAIGSDMNWKTQILQPYWSRPTWCGDICGNDQATTQEFYEKAHIADSERYGYTDLCDPVTPPQIRPYIL